MRIFALTFLILISFFTAGARTEHPASAIRVGVSVSVSGPLAPFGRMYEKGLRLWVAECNARGGIQGRAVELLVADDASDPAKAAQSYLQFAGGGADLLLGPMDASAALAMLPALETNKMPCVFPTAATEELWTRGNGLAFGVLSPISDWPAGFYEIVSRAGVAHAALLAVDHPGADAILAAAAKWAKRYGIETVYSAAVTAKDLPSALETAKALKAEAVAVWIGQDGASAVAKALGKTEWTAKPVFVSFGPALALPSVPAREAGSSFTALPWDIRAAKAFPEGERFVQAFRLAYGQDPDCTAAAAYAAGQVLEAAAAKAGSLDKAKLRQALAQLDTLTILGRYGVDPAGRQLRQVPLTLQWQKGKREIVWPQELRTARPAVGR